MVKIKEDKTYLSSLDLLAIENKISELGIFWLRFDSYYTEEQKQNNRREHSLLTSEQWSERCEKIRLSLEQRMERIIDIIHDKLLIYQYKNKHVRYSKDDWDLSFWCNSGDMSYVTLSPNKKRTNEQQKETVDAVLELIRDIEDDGIQVYVQYEAIYDEEEVRKVVDEYCKEMDGQFIEYGTDTGKIIKTEEHGYVFKKKNAKSKMHYLNDKVVLNNALKEIS